MGALMVAGKNAPKRRSCHYCDARATTWDHIVPKARGGTDTARSIEILATDTPAYSITQRRRR